MEVFSESFARWLGPGCGRNVSTMTALTLDEAQQRLPDAVEKALNGEEVAITVGRETVRLVHDVRGVHLGTSQSATATPQTPPSSSAFAVR